MNSEVFVGLNIFEWVPIDFENMFSFIAPFVESYTFCFVVIDIKIPFGKKSAAASKDFWSPSRDDEKITKTSANKRHNKFL